MKNKFIILVVLLIIAVGGISAWQYFRVSEVPEEEIQILEKEVIILPEKTPEDVISLFLKCRYGHSRGDYVDRELEEICVSLDVENTFITERFRDEITLEDGEIALVDTVIWAQDVPGPFIVGEATIINDTAFLIVTTPQWEYYRLQMNLALVDNQWRIDDTIRLDKLNEKTIEKTTNLYSEALKMENNGWEIYKNEKYGFKFKIPAFFVENGYKIVLEERQYPWLAKITFKTKPLNPDRPNRYFPMKYFAVYSQEYCKNKGKEFCTTIRTGIPKREGDVVFSRFLIENENYFIFRMGGPGFGDPWCWAGWLTNTVQENSQQMLSTFQFLE